MQPNQNWDGCYGAELLRAPNFRRILAQCEMHSHPVVIGSVIVQNPTRLRFVEHDQLIESFRLIFLS
jgi:hypothetical protein